MTDLQKDNKTDLMIMEHEQRTEVQKNLTISELETDIECLKREIEKKEKMIEEILSK